MRWFRQKISLALILSLLQLFVAFLCTAAELPCSEDNSVVCEAASCCQSMPSTQLACCDRPVRPTTDSAAAPATVEGSKRTSIDLTATLQFVEAYCDLSATTSESETASSFNPHLTNNQRYKLLATFLI